MHLATFLMAAILKYVAHGGIPSTSFAVVSPLSIMCLRGEDITSVLF